MGGIRLWLGPGRGINTLHVVHLTKQKRVKARVLKKLTGYAVWGDCTAWQGRLGLGHTPLPVLGTAM